VAGSLGNGLAKRVSKLEELDPTSSSCPACGFDGDLSDMALVFAGDLEEDEEIPEESTYCSTCGGPIDIVIKFEEDLSEE
jgi:transposase